MDKNTIKNEKNKILNAMRELDPMTKEYENCLQRLKELTEIEQKGLTINNPVIISTISSLASLILVLRFEVSHTITSKTFNWLNKRN